MKRSFKEKSTHNRLVKSIQMVLASSVLVTGVSHAVLRDHGPISSADHFPLWYREAADAGGMALGQCTFADDAGNGPLCLTSTADALPDRFAGNIGDEAFYGTADIIIPLTGGEIAWMGHLEMAYLTADGSPPAVWDAANPQEVVFSRERIRIDLPTTDTGVCSGQYTIRTPFGVHTPTMEEGDRALFYTDDILPVPGDFNAALRGHTGPFLTWDVGLDGLTPVSAENPAVVFTPPAGAPRKYIGDPNVEHAFVGSTLPAGPGHEDLGFNNYLEITPPAGCDIGAGPGAPLFNDQASISGLIWDLPIEDPVVVSSATYTRNASTSALDVWVQGGRNKTIALSASNNNSQHLPSITLPEEIVDGNRTGRYHAHLEFDKTQAIPGSVTAVNLSSNPQSRASKGVVDAVVITKSVFDPNTNVLCISAHSGDEESPIPLHLEAPGYGAFGAGTASCPAIAANDVVLEKDLDDFAGDNRIPPEGILVQSDLGGQEVSHPISLTGVTDASVISGAVEDKFSNVKGTATTQLDLTGPAFDLTPAGIKKETDSTDTTPGTFRIVVVSQPVNGAGDQIGTITAPANGGTVTFAADEGMDNQTLTFYYAIQDTANLTVTNVAKVDLEVVKSVPPPVGVPDSQGVFRTSAGSIIPVLANDVTGLSTTPINPASILFDNGLNTAPVMRGAVQVGTVTANNDGTVTYVPQGQGLTANNTIDTFTYTVANTEGSRSTPITVQVVLKTALEAVAFQRVRWSGTRWDIRFTSTYAGPAGAISLAPTATCSLISNPGNPAAVGVIASNQVPGAGTNAYQVVGTGPAAVNNNWTVRCTTSSGGAQNRTGTL